MRRVIVLLAFAIGFMNVGQARFLLLPMDVSQSDHLRAYGVVFSMLQTEEEVNWLLNYRGGSFLVQEAEGMTDRLLERGVFFERLQDEATADLLAEILNDPRMDAQVLVKAPRIAVYGPMEDDGPWGDAVVNMLDYAGIAYTRIFDREVLDGELKNFDWLHIHHEDFTGQYGKCYTHFRHQGWYAAMVATSEASAEEYGYATVREMKLAVAMSIRTYVNQGGFFFAMCSAADTYEIALAAEGLDFVDKIYDGTPALTESDSYRIADHLNFDNTLAFENFEIILNPLVYEHSNIDANYGRQVKEWEDFFNLSEYSATEQPEQSMLVQNHENRLKGFLGQTTAFRASLLKKKIEVLGRIPDKDEARYIHGNYGEGAFTFLGGHDPEDYMHFYGEEDTDISAHRNSPGYRLILNNVFYPSARLNQDDVLQVRKVEVYPNPNQGKFELRFESKETQTLEISLYNVLHQEIYTKTLETQTGFTSLPINLRRVVKGIYFLEMRKDDFAVKRKVVVL